MPRVVWISFDRLHTGYLGCYGNDWIETPHLDRLAGEGVVFDEAFAEEVDPAFAGEGWWRIPAVTGGAAPTDVCEVLRAHGVHTVCLYEADPLESSRRLPRFDEFVSISVDDREMCPESETSWGRFADAVARWLAEHRLPDNCLLWLHSRGIPEPWYPPAEYQDLYFPEFGLADDEDDVDDVEIAESEEIEEDETEGEQIDGDDSDEEFGEEFGEGLQDECPVRGVLTTAERGFDEDRDGETATGAEDDSELEPDDELQRRLGRALYAACATAVDRLTGRMVTALREAGVLDDSLLVISAARGQALGEHTPIGVEPSLPHAELTHVPLLVRGPNPNWPGVRIRDLVQPADVRSLVLDWLSPRAADDSGPSRIRRMLDSMDASTNSTHFTSAERPEVAIAGWRDHGWMIRDRNAVFLSPWAIPGQVDAPECRLYGLPADRHEFADILAQATEDATRLWQELRSRVAPPG